MGEAKRRQELGLPPKAKKVKKTNSDNKLFSLSKFSLQNLKRQFPAAPFVTTSLLLLILQWRLSINS
tara:strand:+ start:18 stop:218 length:201 start_codon:yes stop_codon:yes gene_type:complete